VIFLKFFRIIILLLNLNRFDIRGEEARAGNRIKITSKTSSLPQLNFRVGCHCWLAQQWTSVPASHCWTSQQCQAAMEY